MQNNRLTSSPSSKRTRFRRSLALSLGLSITSLLLVPFAAMAESKELEWARVDFLSNRVQLVPREQRSRRARIADVLSIGDALRTARASRAELRFNDGSLARIGERATFRFTPNTRNFQLSNGTVLLLIPPGRGRSTIQTPNAVTGIQGSALFVRYIPETDTTIVGALTDNPNGPMVLFNEAGTEQQALRSNEIGVITGDRITEIYQFDGALFWQSSGLAEGFDYLSPPSGTGDPLDGVRQEIREAISNQRPIDGDGVIENPDSFSRPAPPTAPVESAPEPTVGEPVASTSESDSQASSSGAQSGTQAGEQTISQAGKPTDLATQDSTTPVVADSTETGSAVGSVSETEAAVAPIGSDNVSLSETPASSEDLDLEVALDLELELELETDGVEAPELDINETVQQYLEGNIADPNSSLDLGAENSLESVNADNVEEEPAFVNSSINSAAEKPVVEIEAPDAQPEVPIVDGSATPDSNSSGGDVDDSEVVDSEVVDSEVVDSTDSGSEAIDSDSSNIESDTSGLDSSLESGANDGLDSGDSPVSSDTPAAAAIDDPVTNIQPDTGVAASESTPTDLTVDSPPTVMGTNSAVMAAPSAPTDVAGEVAGDAVVDDAINVVDISPTADEPPVQIFQPTDEVDDAVLIHSADNGMGSEDNMTDDMMDMDMDDDIGTTGVLGDAVINPPDQP